MNSGNVEVAWRKSSHSESANCVEAGTCPHGDILVRDSKNPGGPVLRFTPDEWAAFTAGVRTGELELG